jgi:accessory colonization factor AcfC
VLESGEYRLIGQVPPHAAVIERAQEWMAGLAKAIKVAAGPRAG